MSGAEVLVALAIAVGVVGVVVPVLPGSLLVFGAILVWALNIGGSTAWIVFAVATAFLVLGAVVKYVVPGRRLKEGGVPASTLVLGGLLGIVGFFVIPVVGLLIGFVVGVYLAELARVGRDKRLARHEACAQGSRALDADRAGRESPGGRHLGDRSGPHMTTPQNRERCSLRSRGPRFRGDPG